MIITLNKFKLGLILNFNLISVKAFIHQPGMYDIEIKKGHTFRYDIWFGGEPPPTVTWEREGVVIQPEQVLSLHCQHQSY